MATSAVRPEDKRALLDAIRKKLQSELEENARRARDAAEAATHEENRPENDKDMRSTEASYVARGQAERVREIEQAVARLTSIDVRAFGPEDAVASSAIVSLESDGERACYFLLPVAGGIRVRLGELEVQTLTTTSPLGQALLGATAGDEVALKTPRGPRTYEVVEVR